MERHIAWLTALVAVVAVWLGLLCCGAKARKTERAAQRESLDRESIGHGNGDEQNGRSDLATRNDVEGSGNGRCVVEEAREQNGVLMQEMDDMRNATQAKNASVATEEFGPCIGSKSNDADMAARQHTRGAEEEVQEEENGTPSVVIICVEKS